MCVSREGRPTRAWGGGRSIVTPLEIVVLALVGAALLRLIGTGFQSAAKLAIGVGAVLLALRFAGADVVVELELDDVPAWLWEILQEILQSILQGGSR